MANEELSEEATAAVGCCFLLVVLILLIFVWRWWRNKSLADRVAARYKIERDEALERERRANEERERERLKMQDRSSSQPPYPQTTGGAPVIYNIYGQGPQPHERITTREIIKVRCSYCGKTYDEAMHSCPHCGGGD